MILPSKNVELRREECLTLLGSLPDESVDVVVTDPAYSGMNQHLKLGHGRIVPEARRESRTERGQFLPRGDIPAGHAAAAVPPEWTDRTGRSCGIVRYHLS